ncbi:MAG: type VI secretion system lipoprotein TssJ [Myxococcales bacterium]|nr:type VI secretion system lipoprotein TssJ [Myxococcales bacterium]MCB9714644.1 type VI secretion system lipoprotein TssJ [Myxococcales bacterium]
MALLGSSLALAACKKDEDTCKPEEKGFTKFRVVVQASERLNRDSDGNSRATHVRIYQIKGGRSLDVPLDFRQVWQSAGDVFGDELLKEEEIAIEPGHSDVFELEPDPEATHVVAAAIFREPVATTWYAEWEVPQYHGYSVCAAEKKNQSYEDPCFLLYMEDSQIDGGHEPPPGMDAEAISVVCPPAPLKVKPAEPEDKKKKKKKGKLKDKAGDAQDKGADAQDKADTAQGASDKAQGAADAASDPPVPGKD